MQTEILLEGLSLNPGNWWSLRDRMAIMTRLSGSMMVSLIALAQLAVVAVGSHRAGRAQTAAASAPFEFNVRLDGRVTDAADILSPRHEKLLAAKLARFDATPSIKWSSLRCRR